MNRQDDLADQYVRRHLQFGWWSLLAFLTVGIGLEALHGFKVAWYLNVGMETRRLMWRLAHAHGTFLSLVHIALAFSLFVTARREQATTTPTTTTDRKKKNKKSESERQSIENNRWYPWASRGLIGASLAVPGGFFLGGLVVRGGDPGLGVIVLPIGALLLLLSVFITARAMHS